MLLRCSPPPRAKKCGAKYYQSVFETPSGNFPQDSVKIPVVKAFTTNFSLSAEQHCMNFDENLYMQFRICTS